MASTIPAETVKELKNRIAKAFATLRKQGVLARMDFLCCSTCGHDAMDRDALAMVANGRRIKGYAFYHAQDAQVLEEHGKVHIGYDYVANPSGSSTAEHIGRLIVETCTAAGLTCEWNGDSNKRILVH
jgi:hypothetical protein